MSPYLRRIQKGGVGGSCTFISRSIFWDQWSTTLISRKENKRRSPHYDIWIRPCPVKTIYSFFSQWRLRLRYTTALRILAVAGDLAIYSILSQSLSQIKPYIGWIRTDMNCSGSATLLCWGAYQCLVTLPLPPWNVELVAAFCQTINFIELESIYTQLSGGVAWKRPGCKKDMFIKTLRRVY